MSPCSCGHVYYKASHQVQFLPNTGVAALFHNPCQFQQCDQSGITLCQIKIWHSGFQRLEFQKDRSELKCDFRSSPPQKTCKTQLAVSKPYQLDNNVLCPVTELPDL